MKICMPVDRLNGLDSPIAPSFRAAPALLVVDSASMEYVGLDAASGTCGVTPKEIDAIVCAGGIGRGMFNGLRSHGIRVFNTSAATVAEALNGLAAGSLEEVAEVACCGGGHHAEEAPEHPDGHNCGCSGHPGEEGSGCGCARH